MEYLQIQNFSIISYLWSSKCQKQYIQCKNLYILKVYNSYLPLYFCFCLFLYLRMVVYSWNTLKLQLNPLLFDILKFNIYFLYVLYIHLYTYSCSYYSQKTPPERILPTKLKQIKLDSNNNNISKEMKILVHGYNQSPKSKLFIRMRNGNGKLYAADLWHLHKIYDISGLTLFSFMHSQSAITNIFMKRNILHKQT